MSVALVVTSEGEAERLLPWAWTVAIAESVDLIVIRVLQRDDDTGLQDVTDTEERERLVPGLAQQWDQLNTARSSVASAATPAIDEGRSADEPPPVPSVKMTVKQLVDAELDTFLIQHLPKLDVTVLLLPLDERIRDADRNWQSVLYRHVGCEAIFVRSTGTKPGRLNRILVPTAGGDNADTALRRAIAIAQAHDAEVTALYVERPVGRDAEAVGMSILSKVVARAAGRAAKVTQKVIVAPSLMVGVQQEIANPYDLILVGAYGSRTIRKIFFGAMADELIDAAEAPAFAAVRAPFPVTTRLGQFVKRHVSRVVPQLDRAGRVKIVERVQSSSKWDFDFIALTCLSTLIAALGLAGNQAAVVIGAMLVAPLMTPLIGAGLSLIQGNAVLIRDSLKSLCFGFLLAFLLGCCIGFVVPMERVPSEILHRTHPSLLDLAVALVSGIAAAYAMSRPNLVSALPGVAIAAALVPPIAVSGLSVALAVSNRADAYHHWVHAFGAIVLFATNIVAIVLGTALALWLVGIQAPPSTTGSHSKRWARWMTIVLLVALVGLGFLVSHKRELHEVRSALRQAATDFTADHRSYAVVTDVRRGPSKDELIVALESDAGDLHNLSKRLRQVAATFMGNDQLRLRLEIRNVVIAER